MNDRIHTASVAHLDVSTSLAGAACACAAMTAHACCPTCCVDRPVAWEERMA
ncbi:MAG: hypothetical protein ACKOCT_06865 [Alphaproteobacteria bacterium]